MTTIYCDASWCPIKKIFTGACHITHLNLSESFCKRFYEEVGTSGLAEYKVALWALQKVLELYPCTYINIKSDSGVALEKLRKDVLLKHIDVDVKITFTKLKGHKKNETREARLNNLVDKLARKELRRWRDELSNYCKD